MDEESLIGVWSSAQRLLPVAMSDEMLVFLPDHRGFLRIANPAMEHTEYFSWTLNDDDSLAIKGTSSHYHEWDDPSASVVENSGRLQFDRLRFTIEIEAASKGTSTPTLTFVHNLDAWRKYLFDVQGLISEKFGLVRRHDDS